MGSVTVAPPPARPSQARRAFTFFDIWKIVGIVLLSLVGLWFFARIIDVVLVFFAAVIFAEAIRPLVQWGRDHLRLPRWAATVLVYLVIMVVLGLLIYVVVAPVVEQAQNLTTSFPVRLNKLELQLNTLQQSSPAWNAIFNALQPETQQFGTTLLSGLLSVPSTAFSVLFNVVFTLFLAFYWLNSTDGLRGFFISLFPCRAQGLLGEMLGEMGLQLGGYVRSVVINMIAIGLITSVALWILGIPYPLVLGVFAALTEAVPLIGPYIGAVPAVLLALSISPVRALLVIATYVVVQQFESNTLVPLVVGRTVGLNPLVTLLWC